MTYRSMSVDASGLTVEEFIQRIYGPFAVVNQGVRNWYEVNFAGFDGVIEAHMILCRDPLAPQTAGAVSRWNKKMDELALTPGTDVVRNGQISLPSTDVYFVKIAN